ncbi:MAG: biotin--[acetyl-CoA-carboxylase] ligase [Ruminococcus sp.]
MKNEILQLLKEKNTFVSGQALCEKFNVSRTAVWKAINSLKETGYVIESVTNKGYRLVSSPDIVNESEIKSMLKTSLIGKEIIVLESVGSTNDYIKANAQKLKDGTVVTAREQTKGKGRLGRVWKNKKDDDISFSFILRPSLSPMEVSAITPLCGLAVAKGLNEYFDFDAKIKWPNDIIVGNKKICGMLTEMSCEFDRLEYLVVGIGINVMSKDFPEEIAHKATSCALESHKEINKNQLLAIILEKIEDILLGGNYRFNRENLDEYKACCATLGRKVTFSRRGERVEGVATDINNEGELVVTLPDNTTETVFSGEVTAQGIY